ncbi:cupin domain-containing protein [Streptomyces sp. CA-111067]|uniref:cupin domain-containing protein n=1 Tax=Streptomyces sp. CA-111067 TaxID=3240046 RepID=UPI003D95D214
MFRNTSSPVDLSRTLVHLREGGVAEPSARPGTADPGLWTIGAIHADNSKALHSDVWERHPTGQEVLCVLSGTVHVHLRDHDAGNEPFATVTAGHAFIVPAGTWHRLTVAEPADLLAVTPRAETQHERVRAA